MYPKTSSNVKLAYLHMNKYNTFIQDEICFKLLLKDVKTGKLFICSLCIDFKCNGSEDSSFGLDGKFITPLFL